MTIPEVLSLHSGSSLCPGQMGQEGDGQPDAHMRGERVGGWVGRSSLCARTKRIRALP